jgi:hypothetical protein
MSISVDFVPTSRIATTPIRLHGGPFPDKHGLTALFTMLLFLKSTNKVWKLGRRKLPTGSLALQLPDAVVVIPYVQPWQNVGLILRGRQYMGIISHYLAFSILIISLSGCSSLRDGALSTRSSKPGRHLSSRPRALPYAVFPHHGF